MVLPHGILQRVVSPRGILEILQIREKRRDLADERIAAEKSGLKLICDFLVLASESTDPKLNGYSFAGKGGLMSLSVSRE